MDRVTKIALAGLLHDLGKFRQRAGMEVDDGYLHLYSRSRGHYFSHIHAAHTAKGLEELGVRDEELINWAAKHHLPAEELGEEERIVQLADRYASRLDRRESDEPIGSKDFVQVAIETPFSFVHLGTPPTPHYYPVQKLEGDPKITSEKRANSPDSYRQLYLEFLEEFKREQIDLNSNPTPMELLRLKSLLEKYTTFIPAATYKTYPEVSLFDHSLATSAIAVAIANRGADQFSLIQGDFTSIQNFIFTKFGESHKKLGKILRAKSLFVSIATEIVALKIVEALNLRVFNIVMNAGGKFTILSHHLSDEELRKLAQLEEWVNSQFEELNFLGTKFAIGTTSFSNEKFKLGEFSAVYRQMAEKFEERKLQFVPPKNQFSDYLERALNGVCSLCGIVPTEKGEERCRFCKKFEEIGELLVKPEYRYLNFQLDRLTEITLSPIPIGPYYFQLRGGHPIKRVANYVATFSEEEVGAEKYRLLLDEQVWRERAGGIKSFYHLAVDGLERRQDGYYGRKYLAVLKADLDSLGKIFICGFHGQETFSRILYLSRMLDYFFTTVLGEFVKGKNIYTLFAGGDDLFLIGHYRDIIETYRFILEKLPDYTKNPDFHLSSAIVLFKPATPIHLIADEAEERLEEAKGGGKNRVAIFQQLYPNQQFLELLSYLYRFRELYPLLRQVGAGTAFLYRLYPLLEMAAKMKRGEDLLNSSRWYYLYHYLVEKLLQQPPAGVGPEVVEELRRRLKELGRDIERWDQKLVLPLNLFLYSIRKNEIRRYRRGD